MNRVRNIARVATNLNLAHHLFKHALLVAHARRLAIEIDVDGDFDLLSLNQPLQISVNQTTTHGINLAIMEHDFTRTDAFNINREDGVEARVGAKNRRQVTNRSDSRHGFAFTAINGDRNKAVTS